jgi:hypothetical protein
MAEAASYPVIFEAAYPERLSRWKTLLRLFLAIPVLIFSQLVGGAQTAVVVGSWAAIVVRGYIPRWLFDFQVALYRWQNRAFAYCGLLTEVYPTFEGDYPVNYDVRYPERLIRWKVLIWKVITSIPHLFVLFFLGLGALIVTIIAWFFILVAGRYPQGLFGYVVGVMRWGARVNAYLLSLTDEYPPYSLSADAGPAGGDTYLISSVLGVLMTGGIVTAIVLAGIFGQPEEIEVQADYASLQAGNATAVVEASDILVTLERVRDPVPEGVTLLDPEAGSRFITFGFAMWNTRDRDITVKEEHFELKDEEGDKHDPVLVAVDGHPSPEEVGKDRQATVLVMFEVPEGVDPSELEFSPGLLFGEKVKYIFE